MRQIFQLGQGSLGLEDTDFYNNETAITAAYLQFMIDLATLLTNNTSAIQADVQDIYAFEKNISQVIPLQCFLIFDHMYTL